MINDRFYNEMTPLLNFIVCLKLSIIFPMCVSFISISFILIFFFILETSVVLVDIFTITSAAPVTVTLPRGEYRLLRQVDEVLRHPALGLVPIVIPTHIFGQFVFESRAQNIDSVLLMLIMTRINNVQKSSSGLNIKIRFKYLARSASLIKQARKYACFI